MGIKSDLKNSNPRLVERICRIIGYSKGLTSLDPSGIGSLASHITEHAVKHYKEIRDKQIENYYKELLRADDDEFVELPDSMNLSDLDFVALLGACSSELEVEKAEIYARLTKSIANGVVEKEYKRHFIITLSNTAFEDLETLRLAYVCKNHNVMNKSRNLRLNSGDVLKVDHLGAIGSICLEDFARAKLIEAEGISSIGEIFIKAIYPKDQLTPASLGYSVWQNKTIELCFADNNVALGWMTELVSEFRKLGIRCENYSVSKLNSGNFSRIRSSGVIFIGGFINLEYGDIEKVKKWCGDHVYQTVWIGFYGNGMPQGCPYGKSISLSENSNLLEAAKKAAIYLKYVLPDFITANKNDE